MIEPDLRERVLRARAIAEGHDVAHAVADNLEERQAPVMRARRRRNRRPPPARTIFASAERAHLERDARVLHALQMSSNIVERQRLQERQADYRTEGRDQQRAGSYARLVVSQRSICSTDCPLRRA